VAFKLRPGITRYQEKYYNKFEAGDILSPPDWASLGQILEFLQLFERITKEVEGDQSTLDKVLYTIDFLVKHYEKMAVRHLLIYLVINAYLLLTISRPNTRQIKRCTHVF
jgi:hypothetical protein